MSIHASIFFRLSEVGSRGQQLHQGAPDFPVPSNIGDLLLGDPEAIQSQRVDVIPPSGPWSAPGSSPSGTCLEDLPREALEWHPNQMPEPPQLAPFQAKELYSEALPSD